MVFLTKSWAVKYQIRIQWIYTEAGHGKSAADGIGGRVKNMVKDKVAFNREYTIKTMEDIVRLIENDTTIELMIHTKDDVEKVADSLPNLSSLKYTKYCIRKMAKYNLKIFQQIPSTVQLQSGSLEGMFLKYWKKKVM